MKKYDIFISYRRKSSYTEANMIALKLMMAGYSVFIDMEELCNGKFNKQLYNAIDSCKDFLLVLSPNDLDRCENEDDWVRKEISRAIFGKKRIIPIMLNGFVFPEQIPIGLEEIKEYHGLSMGSITALDAVIYKLQKRYLKSKRHPLVRKVLMLGALSVALVIFMLYCSLHLYQIRHNVYSIPKTYLIEFSDTTLYNSSGRFGSLSADVQNSLKEHFIGAKKGDPISQYALGKMCYDLNMCRDMQHDAVHWFSIADNNGNAEAANMLGCCYYHGFGVPKSPYRALQLFLKSAKSGCADGANNAGKCYSEGSGTFVPKYPNYKEAFRWYSKASVNSQKTAALYNVGRYYLDGRGCKKDVQKGLDGLRNAAGRGSESAAMMLGDIYREGRYGVQKDCEEAAKYYNMAYKSKKNREVRQHAADELFKLQNNNFSH